MKEVLHQILEVVIIAAAPYLVVIIGQVFLAGIAWARAHVENRRIKDAMDIIASVVIALEETEKKALKELLKDGQLSDADKKYLKDLAIRQIKDQLGPKGLEFLKSVKGDTEGWIKTQIETILARLKGRYL